MAETTTSIIDTLHEDELNELKSLIEEIWSETCKTMDLIVANHDEFGFDEIEEKINPSIEDISLEMSVLSNNISKVDVFDENLDYSTNRQVSNIANSLLLIRDAISCIRFKNRDDYETVIGRLRKQARH